MKTLIVTDAAMRQLNAPPPHIRKQIRAKLDRFAQTGAGNVTVLQGGAGSRLRSRNYRVIFYLQGDAIIVTAVGDRRGIYD